MERVNPNDPTYAGVYRRTDAKGVSTLYINYRDTGKVKNVRIGPEPQFDPATARDIRAIRIMEQRPDTEPSDITMDEAFQEYSTTYARIQQIHDIKNITSRYNKHIHPMFGDMKLKDITNIMINRQKVHWMAVVSRSTVKQIMSLMSGIYHAVGVQGLGLYHGLNPVLLATKIQVEKSRLRFLTKYEAQSLMDVLQDTNVTIYRICAFCLYAGLRKNEAMSIRRANIDLENDILIIKTKDKKQGRMAALPIMPQLRCIIENILAEEYYKPNQQLFPMVKFNYRAFYEAVDFCGLNDNIDWDDPDILPGRYKVVLHTLRHSFASHLVGEGVPLETVRRLMRHSSILTTEIYAKVNDQQLKDGINAVASSYTSGAAVWDRTGKGDHAGQEKV